MVFSFKYRNITDTFSIHLATYALSGCKVSIKKGENSYIFAIFHIKTLRATRLAQGVHLPVPQLLDLALLSRIRKVGNQERVVAREFVLVHT